MENKTTNSPRMGEDAHTPPPWRLSAVLNPVSDGCPPVGFRIEYSDGCLRSIVAECRDHELCVEHGTIGANAALIVRAVNNHASLVAALESLLRNATDKARYIAALESPESDIEAASLPDEALDSPEMKQARAALAAARNT